MNSVPPPRLFDRDVRRLHGVGVGGMGLGPLAIYLAGLGFTVSGEDDAMTETMRTQLERAGVRLTSLPDDCELLVYSSAIAPSHPARVAAGVRQLPVVRRGELLAEAVRDKRLVGVCGAHGKTTTTAMLVTALRQANFPAGYVLGGLFNDDRLPPARVGTNDWVVAEIDESDGTIDRFSPEIAVVTNLDWDHPDHYRRPADLEATFAELFRRTRGTVLVSEACAVSTRLAPARAVTFGPTGQFSAVVAQAGAGRQQLELGGRFMLAQATVQTRGAFNAANATAALAAAQLMGAAVTPAALAAYPGVRRRQGVLHASSTLTVIEDYAHHPAEIRALLESLRPSDPAGPADARHAKRLPSEREAGLPVAAVYDRRPSVENSSRGSADSTGSTGSQQASSRQATPSDKTGGHRPPLPNTDSTGAEGLRRCDAAGGRLLVVFQPHRYSRTAQFKGDFAAALAAADVVHLLDVYAAGEAPIAGGTSADIGVELRRCAPALAVRHWPGDEAEFFAGLDRDVRPGDLVAFVGAGDIDQKAREWLARRARPTDTGPRWDDLAAAWRSQLAGGTKLLREEPLAPKTTMRVGGSARLYAEPADVDDLRTLVGGAQTAGVPLFLLGRGSNLIVPDEGVDGLVIALAHPAWAGFEARSEGRVWAGAGLRLKNLCGLALQAGLAGFEFLEGIPGSVGGALRMNAGAMGGWMFDVVEEVQVMTGSGEVQVLRPAEMGVAYRQCAALREGIALGALLRPKEPAAAAEIGRLIGTYRRQRHETQPREPSAGCVFKNPPEGSAGRLIEECGLKGTRVGGAEVSPLHANFIVNLGTATAGDVLDLVRLVRARVRQLKGVALEPEVLLYGKNWQDVL
jgi:UDP-N-acetylenolpyruvoylglucosamine reductase